MTAQPLPEQIAFGERYWLTELLAVGGMAEIYLARQNAMAGFEKDVVIKRLKPQLAKDRRIVDMFLDEARISAMLNHPNIVHVYDVDVQDDVPYIAMEFINGEEMNILCRRGLQLGHFLPLSHAVELLRQAASGMGYFHAMRDSKARNMDIVHCDISPTNLLVTQDGFLKIIDFGIARASNSQFRDETAIPGKLSYMSPEQASRERTDHRSDIFSLGVVLYEITVGKRLFKGPAHDVIKRLVECDIQPPTFVRNKFPGALESICMRALERYPGDRYQSAYDLADDLEDFLRGADLHSGPVKIARYLDELTMAAGGERRPELISEAEHAREDDLLDFDRGMFDGYEPSERGEGEEELASDWDEFEESEREVAAALGIDPDMLDPATRTPVPSAMAAKAIHHDAELSHVPAPEGGEGRGGEDDVGPPDSVPAHAGGGGAAPQAEADAAPGPPPSRPQAGGGGGAPEAEAEGQLRSDPAPTADSVSRRNHPRARTPVMPGGKADSEAAEGVQLPWIPIGAGVAAAVAAILYFLLS